MIIRGGMEKFKKMNTFILLYIVPVIVGWLIFILFAKKHLYSEAVDTLETRVILITLFLPIVNIIFIIAFIHEYITTLNNT